MTISDALADDATVVAEIYNHYVLTSIATFELETIDAAEMECRINDTREKGLPFIVGKCEGAVVGYSFGRPFRPRPGYRFAVEISVYIHPEFHRRGIAKMLYENLIPQIFDSGAHSLIATIALLNDASVHLHEKFGFNKVAHFCEVGRKFDRWIDVGFWQLVYDSDRS